jgi:hypothetical protein
MAPWPDIEKLSFQRGLAQGELLFKGFLQQRQLLTETGKGACCIIG